MPEDYTAHDKIAAFEWENCHSIKLRSLGEGRDPNNGRPEIPQRPSELYWPTVSQPKLAVRTKPYQPQRMIIGLLIDQHQIGSDVAITVVLPVAG
jgi:hypothetical protein